ncbi:MAG: GrpB family protein [Dehalococcoidia bacterium]
MPGKRPYVIVLAEYDTAWPTMFREERARLESAIGQWAVAIEHVGSTSIPRIAAKPIIDIGVALGSFEDALFCITPLVEIGYECLGEFGIPRRIYFRKRTDTPLPGQMHNSGIGRTHQIHMYEQTHEQFVNHLLFRDYLRAHPDSAREYEGLKRRLAAEHDGVEAYAEAKTEFVKRVLAQAGGRSR